MITRELIEQTVADKIFTAVFKKKNGERRVMNCRLGVKKHLRGGVSTTKHIDTLLTVFDMQKKQYRNINLETLEEIRFNGTKMIP